METVAITGGGIHDDAELHHKLTLEVITVEGKKFVAIASKEYRCKLFLKNNAKMVNHMIALRNVATELRMKALAAQDDPNAEEVGAGPLPKRSKKQMIDEIDNIVPISVTTNDDKHHAVNVLSAWNDKQNYKT